MTESTKKQDEQTAAAADRQAQWQSMVGFVLFLVIISGLLMGGYALVERLTDAEETPLTGVIIQGERKFITDDDVREAILAGEVGSFFTADVDEIRLRLEAIPWVYSASVRKEWPQRLRIYLVEQQAFAIWNQQQLMNHQGQLFAAELTDDVADLPKLAGPEDAEQEVLNQFRRISEILRVYDSLLVKLELSERFAVSAWLENGIELRLGREARLERVQRFMDLYPLIAAEEPDKTIAYADLRYDTGIAIGWKDNQTN
ncbi:MAG: cell division protein FtsQ/DivIB [Gammaproteobacteria bacterium]|nr:cell division protein FtsQ/DivIB [Gammaproteobacteria bacterium]